MAHNGVFAAIGYSFVEIGAGDGGAVFMAKNGVFAAEKRSFEGTRSKDGAGGAIFMAENDKFTAGSCSFSGTRSISGMGGAVFMAENGTFTADGCLFVGAHTQPPLPYFYTPHESYYSTFMAFKPYAFGTFSRHRGAVHVERQLQRGWLFVWNCTATIGWFD